MQKFIRGFFIDPELEREALVLVRKSQEVATEAKVAAKQIRRSAMASTALVAVAGIGLVGLGAFLTTEEGARFARAFAQGIVDETAKQIRNSRQRQRTPSP